MKERLKKVMSDVNEGDKIQLDNILKKKFKDYTLEDYVFLHEQAERAQYNDLWAKRVREYKEQNKRYREALEFYAEKDNYEWEITYNPQQEINCMVIDDGGEKANKALTRERFNRINHDSPKNVWFE